MASRPAEPKTKPAPRRPAAPRRTITIGVRLTPAEIAALDTFIANEASPGISRAGVVAVFATDELKRLKLLQQDYGQIA